MSEHDLTHVPGREHYSRRYLRGGRVFSYAHQIDTVVSLDANTVLEVGVGNGMVAAALRAAGLTVTTLDIQPDLNPDLVGSVTKIPMADGHVDMAVCCQVLEHLPFEQFDAALRELRRVTRLGLVLSLPDVTRHRYIAFRLPKLGERRWSCDVPMLRSRDMPKERFEGSGHYWEIGFRGYSLKRVRTACATAGWRLDRTWRVPELPWHRFFLLRCND